MEVNHARTELAEQVVDERQRESILSNGRAWNSIKATFYPVKMHVSHAITK